VVVGERGGEFLRDEILADRDGCGWSVVRDDDDDDDDEEQGRDVVCSMYHVDMDMDMDMDGWMTSHFTQAGFSFGIDTRSKYGRKQLNSWMEWMNEWIVLVNTEC
jgi:hypothetical protein